jgi:hypothetical protein
VSVRSSSKPRPTKLDEDVLQARLRLAERHDVRADAGQRPDDPAECRVLREDEVDGHGLARLAVGGDCVRGLDRADHAGQPGQGRRAAGQPIELEPEDRLALDPPLELGREPMARIRPWSTMAIRSHSSSASAM